MIARLTLVLPLLLVGCAAPAGQGESPSAGADASAPGSSFGRESLLPSSEKPSGGDVELIGRLGTQAVEGGCPYLEAADGTRYEVLYPPGWTVDGVTATLRAPDGTVVATAGQIVTVRGREARDMVSTCQIGPIFQATEVVSVD